MSSKIIAGLLISIFSLTVAIADPDEFGINFDIPKYDSSTGGDTGIPCTDIMDQAYMSDPGVITMVPVFEINTYDCAPGYYLPAGDDWADDWETTGGGCIECPSNSFCGGGSFVYSATVTKGLEQCPGGASSPTKSESKGDCGRMFHVGGYSMFLSANKDTTPSLNFDLDHDGEADLFANMTLKDVPMTNDGSGTRLKVTYQGQVYSVYDNTINPDLY